ncbi:thioredoxin reductase 1, partial [Chlamydia psittaci 84-8471/1]
QCF